MLSNGHSSASFNKFNSARTAGLLNPMSPPPPADKIRSSPTLFEMMASEPYTHQRIQTQNQTLIQVPNSAPRQNQPPSVIDKQVQAMQRISYLLSTRSPGNQFNEPGSQKVFAVRLSDRWTMEQRTGLYRDLEVSMAIGFDAGVLSCLEYLEAAPWAEDDEEKVVSLLAELRLENVGVGEVLKRVYVEITNETDEYDDNEQVLLKLLHVVLEGKDEKARCEMKRLVFKMLRENSPPSADLRGASQIARQADNLLWILDILIDRRIGEDFLKTWASQSELSDALSKVPVAHRYEISRVTARLFVGIEKGQLLASKEVRYLLLQTWLVPFYDDFGWMRRTSKFLDQHLIEDGLSNTILTLPLAWQQEILLAWCDRFLNSGEDCPNIQKCFEVWWWRAFWRRSGEGEPPMPITIESSLISHLHGAEPMLYL
ncbi:BTB/POZ domain-containing protein [Hibiscus syriacus]|uniref:BTB/POZ domain-containing protein n=1 Tax=Hibiscus syriacus TaxID=106335 RepID=A0A6A3CIN5_HIBSY|nr:BTB/POZ domain-containing protein [Hibiscus syriacus]